MTCYRTTLLPGTSAELALLQEIKPSSVIQCDFVIRSHFTVKIHKHLVAHWRHCHHGNWQPLYGSWRCVTWLSPHWHHSQTSQARAVSMETMTSRQESRVQPVSDIFTRVRRNHSTRATLANILNIHKQILANEISAAFSFYTTLVINQLISEVSFCRNLQLSVRPV